MSDFNQNFKRAVDTASRTDSSAVLQNGARTYARYLIASLLRKASATESDVKISSGHLNEFIFGSQMILKAARKVLAKGNRIDVICERDPENGLENKFLKLLKDPKYAPLCSTLQRDAKSKTTSEVIWQSFTLIGTRAFRIETHMTTDAFGCFNNPQFAERLLLLFQKQTRSSAEI